MKEIPILTILIVLSCLVSCTTPKFVTQNQEYSKIGLDLNTEAVIIKDKRENVAVSDDLRLPTISHGGQYDIVVPPLKIEHEKIIQQTVFENLLPSSSNTCIITVQILNARKEFAATSWYEKESSYVEIKIFTNIDGNEITITESGEYFNKSIDATYKRSEKIFNNTLKEVTYKALKKLKREISG